MTEYKNILIGGEQKHQSVKTDGICTCLCSAMGQGGGYVPMVVMTVMAERKKERKKENDSQKLIKRQVGIDLCFIESRLVEISACVCVRYDAGICKHKMEHTGVLVEYK